MTLLFVDDEAINLLGFSSHFRREHLVLTTTDPVEAQAICRRQPIDVVFTDQRMPGLCGTELVMALREQRCTARFAVITGYRDDERVKDALERGEIAAVFEKPYRITEVERFIEEAGA